MQSARNMLSFTVLRTLRLRSKKLGFQANQVSPVCRLMCSSSTMKAVIIEKHGGPEELHLAEVPRPTPTKSEVLVKVFAAGVNPVDLFIREGAFMSLPKLPLILGKEVAGIVIEVSSDIKSVKEGDRVVCCLPRDGGYAEYVACEEKNILPLSAQLSFAQGSTLYVSYFVAYRALITKCKIKEGERLFVHGASGGVGISAIQIAKSMGLWVAGSARSPSGRDAVLAAGADVALDHSEKDYLVTAHAVTDGKGFDVIFENCADTNLGLDLMLLAPNGRIAVVGTKRNPKLKKEPSFLPCIVNPRSLMYTEGCIYGVKLIGVTPEEFKETIAFVTNGIEDGWLRPFVGKEFRLGQAAEAHRWMSECPANGKIVLNVQDET